MDFDLSTRSDRFKQQQLKRRQEARQKLAAEKRAQEAAKEAHHELEERQRQVRLQRIKQQEEVQW